MFDYLPMITPENIDVMVFKELPYFRGKLRGCCSGTQTPDEAIKCLCSEFVNTNPLLVNAVRACAYGVAGELQDEVEPEGTEWRAAFSAVAGLLAALRLIDRALEAKELEQRLGS